MHLRNRQPYFCLILLVRALWPVLLAFGLSAQTAAPAPAANAPAAAPGVSGLGPAPRVAPATGPAPSAAPAARPPPSVPELMRQAAEKQRAAAAIQRQAARKQAEMAGARLPDWDEAAEIAEPPPCEPISDDLAKPIIEAAAKAQEVPPELLRAVIEQESGFRSCAISAKDARGLMQLMPATVEEFGVADPFDPKENIGAGAKYLKQLLDKYKGELKLALAAYNAGPTAVDEAAGVPPFAETKDYVQAILEKLGK